MVSKKNIYKKLQKIQKTKKRRNRKIYGGLASTDIASKIKGHNIENVEVIAFLIDFLNRTEFKNILFENFKFINGINENNLSQNFDFGNNPEFRKLLSDIIQWFILDYNKQFVNSILGIIKNTIIDPDFLNKNIDINERYNVLLLNVCNMIDKFNDTNSQENIDINALLRILLKVLTFNNVKQNIMGIISAQGDTITSLKNIIVCLLDNLMKTDLLHDEKIRGVLKEYIEKFSYKTAFDSSNINKLSGLIGNCAFALTADIGSITAKNAYAVGSTTAKNAYAIGSNTAKTAYNSTFGLFSK